MNLNAVEDTSKSDLVNMTSTMDKRTDNNARMKDFDFEKAVKFSFMINNSSEEILAVSNTRPNTILK